MVSVVPRMLGGLFVGLMIPVAASAEPLGYPEVLLWGDTHLHSSFSADANTIGNTNLTPEDAYRFAKGQPVKVSEQAVAQLARPLDFLVVSDHAGFLGSLAVNREKGLLEKVGQLGRDFFIAIMDMADLREKADGEAAQIRKDTWLQSLEMAEQANSPGEFSAIAGFEWTSMPGGDNLHRVVLFKDDIDKTKQVVPFSILESHDPRDLWRYLDEYESETGGSALAIPHNGNVSNGRMFALSQYDGSSMTAEYAADRAHWEPIVEVTQIKGDGEAHPWLSPDDEFANFGTWDKGNLGAREQKKPEMLQFEYARSALKLGLKIEDELGVNPFQFGMIGSTDAHTSLATADDDNFWGKASNYHPKSPKRTQGPFMVIRSAGSIADHQDWSDQSVGPDDLVVAAWEQVASGYAGVWATENTREAIFEAMRRREVYATTGPRMAVRFFGSWGFKQPENSSDLIPSMYRQGVPMGGKLKMGSLGDRKPEFFVMAQRDPVGANLDRIQIVKGWLGADGTLHEKVYDVAWSGDRSIDAEGKLSPVGSTVDTKMGTFTNDIGADTLTVRWRDGSYTNGQRAFYYVRVLQIPTPTWIAYDEAQLGVTHPGAAPRVQQERAYTSPIWISAD